MKLKVWNKVAITKLCWEVENKEDKLWIRWIHNYYIMDQEFSNMTVSQLACWMVRKIFQAKNYLSHITDFRNSVIKQVYLKLLGDLTKVPWKGLMYHNQARPKAMFTMWLQVQGRLLTTDKLLKWGIQTDDTCILCKTTLKNRDHLFAEC